MTERELEQIVRVAEQVISERLPDLSFSPWELAQEIGRRIVSENIEDSVLKITP